VARCPGPERVAAEKDSKESFGSCSDAADAEKPQSTRACHQAFTLEKEAQMRNLAARRLRRVLIERCPPTVPAVTGQACNLYKRRLKVLKRWWNSLSHLDKKSMWSK